MGRTPVLFLDTDVRENGDADRPITHILYVRGREMRLHQELVLGVGDVQAFRALGIDPSVWHLNEGHSALLLAERAREYVAAGDSLEKAWDKVRTDSVFTIHTPVSAGNERFAADLLRRVAGPLLDGDGRPTTGGVPIDDVLELGVGVEGDGSGLDMTAFSLRLTRRGECRRRVHAATADATWRGVSPREIIGVANSIHMPSWIGHAMGETLSGSLQATSTTSMRRVSAAASGKMAGQAARRTSCGRPISARSSSSRSSRGAGSGTSSPATERRRSSSIRSRRRSILTSSRSASPRHFATYKPAATTFSDIDRLQRLLWNENNPSRSCSPARPTRPMGRAAQVIQEIFERSRSEQLHGRVFILELEHKDGALTRRRRRHLAQQHLRRPLEASETSGMKAAANGVVNVSVLDGWWDEGWTSDDGLGDGWPGDEPGREGHGLGRRPGCLPDPRGGR